MDQTWIKVEDRLPPNGAFVLVAVYDARKNTNMYFIQIGQRLNTEWYDDHNGDPLRRKESSVTHWMPLPDDPDERGKDLLAKYIESKRK